MEARGGAKLEMQAEEFSPLSSAQFRTLYPELRRFAAVVADSDIEPDDLVQEAVARYLRRFAGTGGAERPAAYLRSAILGLVSNHRRGTARRHHREALPSDDRHLDSYPSDVRALLSCTTPAERALLLLVDVEGEPIGDAAAVLGIGSIAARARLSRARRRLRVQMEADDDGT